MKGISFKQFNKFLFFLIKFIINSSWGFILQIKKSFSLIISIFIWLIIILIKDKIVLLFSSKFLPFNKKFISSNIFEYLFSLIFESLFSKSFKNSLFIISYFLLFLLFNKNSEKSNKVSISNCSFIFLNFSFGICLLKSRFSYKNKYLSNISKEISSKFLILLISL